MRKIFLLVIALTGILNTGCELMEELKEKHAQTGPYKPKYVISFHNIVKYPCADELERMVTSFSGRQIWVNIHPYIYSKQIKKLELIKRKDSPDKKDLDTDFNIGFYDLKLHLNRRGSLMWMQLSVNNAKIPVALLIDGVFYRSIKPKKTSENDEVVVVEGPFDEVTARLLKKYALKNYKHFQDEDKDDLFHLFK